MFSVLFPGQGSQSPGMAKSFYDNFDYVRSFFKEADDLLSQQRFPPRQIHAAKFYAATYLRHSLKKGGQDELDIICGHPY